VINYPILKCQIKSKLLQLIKLTTTNPTLKTRSIDQHLNQILDFALKYFENKEKPFLRWIVNRYNKTLSKMPVSKSVIKTIAQTVLRDNSAVLALLIKIDKYNPEVISKKLSDLKDQPAILKLLRQAA